MSENNDQPVDPWAPPNQDGVELSKPAAAGPGAGTPGAGTPGAPTSPAHDPVHDQQTVAGMPGVELPPPPVAPGGSFGYPTAPAPAQPTGYGYPAPPMYPGYGQPGWGGPAPANGLGTAAMIVGICAVALAFCSYGILGLILGAVALGLGIAARKRVQRGEATNNGMVTAGITLGSIGLVLGVAGIALIVFLVTHADEWDTSDDDPFSTSLVVDARG
ncbi:hypothetical protein ACIGO8_00330 [Streptomyces sp. NPDC053493]|uniref:hypothetical protein n=1 Tax=Streptomyces sp. NPDC053493 TaxID=3365705 RepID=UPI0037CDA26D